MPQLEENSKPDEVEDDWLTNFFDKCRLISDEEMQGLWSQVLAGEANSPGKYSKRTVNFLSDLDKSDADLFTRLCGFGWVIGDVVPLVYDEQNQIYAKQGIMFNQLIHLESIGLIQFQTLKFKRLGLPKTFAVLYYGRPVILSMPSDNNNTLGIGKVLLTKIGQELAPICGSEPVEGFFEYVTEEWKRQGYIKDETKDDGDTAEHPSIADSSRAEAN